MAEDSLMDTQLLLIGGRSGAGKTTVAAEVFAVLASRDVKHAWIEGDYLDLAHPAPHERGLGLAEQNLAAVWGNYRRAGYHRLVYSNTACVLPSVSASLTAAVGGRAQALSVLLRAAEGEVHARLAARERGSQLPAQLARSAAMATLLDAEPADTVVRIDTDGRRPRAIAEEIVALLEWE